MKRETLLQDLYFFHIAAAVSLFPSPRCWLLAANVFLVFNGGCNNILGEGRMGADVSQGQLLFWKHPHDAHPQDFTTSSLVDSPIIGKKRHLVSPLKRRPVVSPQISCHQGIPLPVERILLVTKKSGNRERCRKLSL